MDISPDETILAIQTLDNKLNIVDVAELRTLTTLDVSAEQVRFNKTGTYLFASTVNQLYTFGIEDD